MRVALLDGVGGGVIVGVAEAVIALLTVPVDSSAETVTDGLFVELGVASRVEERDSVAAFESVRVSLIIVPVFGNVIVSDVSDVLVT